MAVCMHKCSITTIYWTVPCPTYSGIAMGHVKRHRMEMFLNVAASVNSENHEQCLKGYAMSERGFNRDSVSY